MEDKPSENQIHFHFELIQDLKPNIVKLKVITIVFAMNPLIIAFHRAFHISYAATTQ